jgi:LacI family transcriptional regulator
METSRSFGRGVIRGIAKYAQANGPWNLHVHPGDLGQKITLHRGWPLDAVIGRINTRATLNLIRRRRLCSVCLVENKLSPSPIITSRTKTSAAAFDHFRHLGYRRFAYYDQYTSWGMERGQSFAEIVQAAGYDFYPCPTFGRRPAGLAELARWLRQLPKPIGLFAADDLAGREVIDVCRYAQVAVPEEVAVLGVDDDELICGISYPALSSVKLNAERIGYEGAAVLHALLLGKPPTREPIEIDPLDVIARQSTDVIVIEDRLVAQATRYIREHAREGVNIADVLRHTRSSRRTLETRFRREMGRSPHAEILRVQLTLVKDLLITTDLKLQSIAERTGFSSMEYLHRVFRKQFHITPTEFRVRNRKTSG